MSIQKFRGCAVGALIGDCFGAHYEFTSPAACSSLIQHFFNMPEFPKNEFTDDTAMARSVAVSIVEKRGVDTVDLARRFSKEFFKEPHRGYGYSVGLVFEKLKQQDYKDPFGPASEQFEGSGSYGNGGAMRIYPAALFAVNSSQQELRKDVESVTRITHSNKDAINGALLEAYAIQVALRDTSGSVDTYSFLKNLLDFMTYLERESEEENDGSPPEKRVTRSQLKEMEVSEKASYCQKLNYIKDFLQREIVPVKEIDEYLGTDVSAKGSVPAAIYSFLRASQPIPELEEVENPFQRTIIYAISLGGDTDTIATMAGAIAGAFYGIEAVSEKWQNACEALDHALKYADALHKLVISKNESETQENGKSNPDVSKEQKGDSDTNNSPK